MLCGGNNEADGRAGGRENLGGSRMSSNCTGFFVLDYAG